MKKLRVTVEGKSYDVLVEILSESTPPAGTAIKSTTMLQQSHVDAPPAPAHVAPSAVASAAGDIPSPLSGKVVSIDVKVGDAVNQGAQVATVEAMKMNTYIYSPKTGKVAAILVNPGDGVNEGSPLLRIE